MSYLDEASYLGSVSSAVGSEQPPVPSGDQANQLIGLGEDTVSLPGGIIIKRATLMLFLGLAAGALALYLYQRSKRSQRKD